MAKILPNFYFRWKINDIESVPSFQSFSFTVQGVKFRMTYNQGICKDLCAICMEPEVNVRKMPNVSYSFYVSVSLMSPDKECRGLCFTQTTRPTYPHNKDELRHTLWLMGKKDLTNIRNMFVERCEINNVTFFCVFGDLAVCQMEVVNEGIWCKQKSWWRLGDDLNKLRSIPVSPILLKCGGKELQANEFILSTRSEEFAQMFRDKRVAGNEIKIENMSFYTLENFIFYIYSGRLKDRPSVDLLTELYAAAMEYKVHPLKEMTLSNLLENINDPMFICHCTSAFEELSRPSAMVTKDAKGVSKCSHRVEKCTLKYDGSKDCMEEFAYEMLRILSYTGSYNDKLFKGKIISSIVKDYGFILLSKTWIDGRDREYKSLEKEVYDSYVLHGVRNSLR